MAKTDPRLVRAIHGAVGMSDAQMEADPGAYIDRFVAMGVAIIKERERQRPKPAICGECGQVKP